MAKEAGVVKSINGGIARALNDLTGEVRQLSVGDIVYQGEKIVTEGSNSKVTITQTDGKDITLIGKDTLTLDQDSNNNETVADISALQQAILKGTDLNALEETAAGGPQAGGNGGDGVSLSSTSFAEGGHISNINANVGSIDALSLAAGGDNSFGVSGGSAVGAGTGAEATGPALPAGSIKIPLSAYKGESTSSALLDSFASSIPNGYHVYRHTDGRDYLAPNDPTAPSAFDYKEGWYVSKDGNLAIGQDNAKDLAVTSTAKASNYPDDGSVAKIVNPNPNLKVFGSDNVDNITVDGTRITSVRGGVGNDNVDLKNGAEAKGVSGGSGSDNITVESGSKVDTLLGDNKTKNDVHEKAYQASQGKNIDIEDNGAAGDTIKVSGTGTEVKFIGAGNGDDNITVDKGAKVGLIQADEGNDKVTVSDSGTYVKAINGRGGDDDILVEKGAKVDGIVGRWGNDKITVKDAGTVVTQNIEGNEDSDTIKILDGARVKGYVSGGRGEDPSVYGGAKKSDNDNITVENATVDGNVEGSMRDNYSGDDGMKFKNSQIGGRKISGGYGENVMEISDGMNLNSKWIEGNKFNDKITVNGNANLNNTYILGEAGDDTITVNGNAKVKGGNIDTGAGANDKININGNAEIDGTTLQLGASGESTDRATLNVTGNAILKGVLIQASQSSGEQLMNFHQNGEAKIHTITGSNNKDVMDITGNFTVSNKITGNGGDDEINIHGGATAKIQQADMGSGNDKLTVENATLKDSFVNMDGGNDEININTGANLTNTRIYTGEGNNTVNVRGGTFSEAEIGLDKGKNEVNIESGAVFGDQDAGLNAFREHKTYIRSDRRDDYNSEDTINVKAGATVKNAEIQTYGGKDTLNINGTVEKSNIDTGKDNDTINIGGGIIKNSNITTGDGDDTINIKGGKFKDANIQTGHGTNTVNIDGTGGSIESDNTKITLGGGWSTGDNTVNISGKFGDKDASSYDKTVIGAFGSAKAKDTVNIKDGAELHNTRIDLHANDDVINIGAGATVKHSQLITGDQSDTLNIGDGANISEGTHMHLGYHSDTAKIGNNVTIDNSDIYMDNGKGDTDASTFGNDTVTMGNNVTFKNYADVKGGQGDDTITIGNNLTLDGNAGIYGDWGEGGGGVNNATDGNDTITIGDNLTVKNNSTVSGGGGDDVISIGKNASIQDTSTIDGGAGFDTLKVADNSIDFSHVKNIEKLDMTNGEKTTLSLTASNVQDILRDSNENKLKIDGDSNDELTLGSSWTKGASSGGYTTYTSGTTTIEVQDQIHVL
ncbi:beta strand repeat-containing protein [Campylobacter concisus]|uniref:beta strand repeat-containing protein n=1 Tax=Campylobacter concisus TaxID=199 RepID=UPI000D31F190|nr:retention module-containing protein [Campylobacter concisus]